MRTVRPIWSVELSEAERHFLKSLRRERPEMFSGGWDVRLSLRRSLGFDDTIEAELVRTQGEGQSMKYSHALGLARYLHSPAETVNSIWDAVWSAALLLVPMRPAGRWRLFGRSAHA